MCSKSGATLLLLALTGCATPQPAPATAQPGKLVRDGREPGTLSLVPVGSVAESQQERGRPGAALTPSTGSSKRALERASGDSADSQPTPVPPGEASMPSQSGSSAELRLRQRIQNALAKRASLSYTAKHVSVEVEKHNVLLTGDVRTARERAEVLEIVEKIEGVGRVNDQLVVIDQPSQPLPTAP